MPDSSTASPFVCATCDHEIRGRPTVAQRRQALLRQAIREGPSTTDPAVVAAINDIAAALATPAWATR